MGRNDAGEDEPYVVIEERSNDIGPFLLGAALGAALALLLAPRSGVETRAALGRRMRSAQGAAREAAEGVAERVSDTFAEAREELERRIESAREAVSRRTRQLSEAVEAGRSAARQAEADLRSELSRTGTGRSSSGSGQSTSTSPSSIRRPVKRGPQGEPRRGPRGPR